MHCIFGSELAACFPQVTDSKGETHMLLFTLASTTSAGPLLWVLIVAGAVGGAVFKDASRS